MLGGFDVANVPSLNYGLFHKPTLLQFFLKLTYKNSDFLCPVSEALVSSTNKYADPSGMGYKNGLLNFLPEVKDKIKVISTDYDADFWNYNNSGSREGVLALAYIYQPQTYILKGFDILIKCARAMPDTTFTFAGFSPEMINKYEHEMPSNVKLLSFQNKEESRALYRKHKVFAIPSMTEGLPNTLCEAMLCGCIPVGSNIEVISHIINDTGLTLNSKDEVLLKGLIDIAIKDENLSPEKSRKRIMDLYPKGNRIVEFRDLVDL
ncbi:MAG: glycosyltransferase [Saprospiraceae bacterium]